LLFSDPIQEDDFYRYLWDGKVVASGLNPYGIAPSSILERKDGSEAYVRILESDPSFLPILSRVNHPWAPTIYPPVAQGVFGLMALVAPGSLLGLRFIFLAFDLGVCLVIRDLLHHFNRSPAWMLVYAWSPLVLKETINSVHYDVVPTFFLLLASALILRKKWSLAHVSFALAILGKFYPILLLPFFVWRTNFFFGRLRAFAGIAVVSFVLFIGYAPFLSAGGGLWQGAAVFAEQWLTNSFLFPFLLKLVGERWVANVIVSLTLVSLVIALLYWRDQQDDLSFLWSMFCVLGTLFLLSPVGDPWYFVWITPFLCFFPYRSWLLLSGLLGLYYLSFYFSYHRMTEIFRWVIWLEYLPFYAMLLHHWWREKTRSDNAPSSFTQSTVRLLF
jgi:hypothetical protein